MEELIERWVSRNVCLFPVFVILLSFTSVPKIAIHKILPEATYELVSEVVCITWPMPDFKSPAYSIYIRNHIFTCKQLLEPNSCISMISNQHSLLTRNVAVPIVWRLKNLSYKLGYTSTVHSCFALRN